MKTHRCEDSLKAKVSIRYCRLLKHYNLEFDWNRETWRLFNYKIDSEWDCMSQNHVSEIKYCPYCGEKLN